MYSRNRSTFTAPCTYLHVTVMNDTHVKYITYLSCKHVYVYKYQYVNKRIYTTVIHNVYYYYVVWDRAHRITLYQPVYSSASAVISFRK